MARKEQVITFRATPELRAELERIAKREKVTLSTVVSRLVEEGVMRERNRRPKMTEKEKMRAKAQEIEEGIQGQVREYKAEIYELSRREWLDKFMEELTKEYDGEIPVGEECDAEVRAEELAEKHAENAAEKLYEELTDRRYEEEG